MAQFQQDAVNISWRHPAEIISRPLAPRRVAISQPADRRRRGKATISQTQQVDVAL